MYLFNFIYLNLHEFIKKKNMHKLPRGIFQMTTEWTDLFYREFSRMMPLQTWDEVNTQKKKFTQVG